MSIDFYKYQGTGNDFVVIDDRKQQFNHKDHALISSICERKIGVGADGLILLRNHNDYDFEMVYFNSDGHLSSMCGNGGRCIVAFARMLGIIDNETTFLAIDGVHKAKLVKNNIYLRMQDVDNIRVVGEDLLLDTGSPHYVRIVESFENFNIKQAAREIRYSPSFNERGVNVNFVLNSNNLYVRTYERGVEDETLSCGTGVVAVSLAMHFLKRTIANQIDVQTRGGYLHISFEESDGNYTNIWLSGEVAMVYIGSLEC